MIETVTIQKPAAPAKKLWAKDPWSWDPKMTTRPAYPAFAGVLYAAIRVYARDVLLGTCLLALVRPAVEACGAWFAARGYSEAAYFSFGTTFVHSFTFLLFSVPFYVCDEMGYLKRYKLPRYDRHTLRDEQTSKMWREAFLGQCVTTPLAAYFIYPGALKCGMPAAYSSLAFDARDAAKWMAFAHFFNDFGFYWSRPAARALAFGERGPRRRSTVVAAAS